MFLNIFSPICAPSALYLICWGSSTLVKCIFEQEKNTTHNNSETLEHSGVEPKTCIYHACAIENQSQPIQILYVDGMLSYQERISFRKSSKRVDINLLIIMIQCIIENRLWIVIALVEHYICKCLSTTVSVKYFR